MKSETIATYLFAQVKVGGLRHLQREIRGFFFFSGDRTAQYPVCGVAYANLHV